MKPATKMIVGRLTLSVVAVLTIISPFLADWNETHIFNHMWPTHAKFHNAQTMSLAVLLGLSALYFLWDQRLDARRIIAAGLFASLYWLSQLPAFLFPGVAWTDANLLHRGESLSDFPIQLKGDAVLLPLIAAAVWLLISGVRQVRAR